MKISSRATYGILAAVDLAMQAGTLPVRAKSIARRQAIPTRFLEQVLQGMKKAGLISSLRGAQGGYRLSKNPAEVSLVEILEALDGPLFPSNGASNEAKKGTAAPRRPPPERVLQKVWEQVYQAERQVLAAISVETLAEEQRALQPARAVMYHI